MARKWGEKHTSRRGGGGHNDKRMKNPDGTLRVKDFEPNHPGPHGLHGADPSASEYHVRGPCKNVKRGPNGTKSGPLGR